MVERRIHPRRRSGCKICLSNKHFGPVKGRVTNLSDSGVFVEALTASDFTTGMLFSAVIQDTDWDPTLPPLTMKVVRVVEDGIALEFVEQD